MLMAGKDSASSSVGSTSVPNAFFDHLMARLRDTEWRLLGLIVRQTWGWQKEQDWLSHAFLKRKTGRGSAALSRAIRVLVGAKLIVVRNLAGEVLDSASERRREPHGLVFSLHPELTARFLDERRTDDRRANSLSKNNNKKTDKRKTVVVDDRKDSAHAQEENAEVQKEQASKGEGTETRPKLDNERKTGRFFTDPVIKRSWSRVGRELRSGKYRWKRHQ